MMKINKFILAVSASLVWCVSYGQQEEPARQHEPIKIDGVAAVVGKEIVLESDIEGALMQYQLQGISIGENEKCRILEQLLIEKLLAHQGQVDSLEVSEGEISNTVNQRIQMLVQDVGSMKAVLDLYQKADQEALVQDLTPIMRNQLFADRMKKKVIGDLDPSPEDVRRFFNKIPKDSLPEFETEFELATLTITPDPDPKAVEDIINRLKEMKKEIEEGADFRTRAILYSDDPGSAANGGVYNGVKKGQFVKPFEAAAFNLEEGEISDPVQTEYGYHIIQVIRRRGEQLDLQHILMQPKFTPEDLNKAQEKMDSIVSKIRAGQLTFDEAVKAFSQDEATKLNNGNMMNQNTGETTFPISMLDRDMYYAVGGLQQGQVSDPVFIQDPRGGGKYAIFYVRKRTEPHRADYTKDFNKLKTLAKQELQEKKLREWVSKKSKDVFVKISPGWEDCKFGTSWAKIRHED